MNLSWKSVWITPRPEQAQAGADRPRTDLLARRCSTSEDRAGRTPGRIRRGRPSSFTPRSSWKSLPSAGSGLLGETGVIAADRDHRSTCGSTCTRRWTRGSGPSPSRSSSSTFARASTATSGPAGFSVVIAVGRPSRSSADRLAGIEQPLRGLLAVALEDRSPSRPRSCCAPLDDAAAGSRGPDRHQDRRSRCPLRGRTGTTSPTWPAPKRDPRAADPRSRGCWRERRHVRRQLVHQGSSAIRPAMSTPDDPAGMTNSDSDGAVMAREVVAGDPSHGLGWARRRAPSRHHAVRALRGCCSTAGEAAMPPERDMALAVMTGPAGAGREPPRGTVAEPAGTVRLGSRDRGPRLGISRGRDRGSIAGACVPKQPRTRARRQASAEQQDPQGLAVERRRTSAWCSRSRSARVLGAKQSGEARASAAHPPSESTLVSQLSKLAEAGTRPGSSTRSTTRERHARRPTRELWGPDGDSRSWSFFGDAFGGARIRRARRGERVVREARAAVIAFLPARESRPWRLLADRPSPDNLAECFGELRARGRRRAGT